MAHESGAGRLLGFESERRLGERGIGRVESVDRDDQPSNLAFECCDLVLVCVAGVDLDEQATSEGRH
jgi:hypothetical protein